MNTFSVDENGNSLRYLELYADGEPLLYIHGLGCASSSDYPLVALQRKERSLLIDLIGAGFSDKPQDFDYASDNQADVLTSFIASRQLKSVRLFGHSAGAFVALKLARRLSIPVNALVLCEPGLTDYGVSMLSELTSATERQFVESGFSQFLAQLKAQGTIDAWLGPFSVASPRAIHQWARSALEDNASNWLEDLARLQTTKGIILSEKATRDEIARFEEAGCIVECVVDAEHMIAYDNPDGLAQAISNILGG